MDNKLKEIIKHFEEASLDQITKELKEAGIVFMPNPDMDDKIYLCEEGLINCFVCLGKENCNQYRAKNRGLEE